MCYLHYFVILVDNSLPPGKARQRQAELKSVLDPQTKKRVGESLECQKILEIPLKYYFPEILIQRVKKMEPEEIARRIQQFDQEMCSENFLSELKGVLPTPEQVRFPLNTRALVVKSCLDWQTQCIP